MTIPCRTLLLLVPLLGTGCDKIQGLLDGDKAEATNADDAKTGDAKTDDAKADDAKAADAKSDGAETKAAADPADAKPADAPNPADDAKADAGAAPEAAAAPEAGAGDQPCIVGHWEATDYIAQIDRAVRKDPTLRSMKYKSKSGTIGYRIEPPVDGKGVVKATASDLSYKYAGKVQGIGVSLGVTMSGEITASYELAEPSRIIVAKPTENKMRVKANIKLKGLGSARDSAKVDHDFNGDFPYLCTETELTVWTIGRAKRPLKFKRLED